MTPIPLKMTPIPLYSRATTRTEPKKIGLARLCARKQKNLFEFKGLLMRSSILEFEFKVEFKGSGSSACLSLGRPAAAVTS